MAKFTSSAPLSLHYEGHDFRGPAGTEFRLPDSLRAAFDAEFGTRVAGLAWTEEDEIADVVGGSHPDLAAHISLGLISTASTTAHVAESDPHTQYALDTDLANHEADTTSVHGIADTANISLSGHTHAAGAGAPTDADYLVATANAGLSAEIVVGTTPGGELGGTWASPTVDPTHSGSTHAATQAAAEATASGALSTHAAAADPHTGYQKESEKAAASGYASLDGSTKVPLAQLPTGTTSSTVALGDAAAALDATHAAAADPHTGYVKENDANWTDLTDGGQSSLHTHSLVISRGGTLIQADGLTAAVNIIVWRAPFACTVTAVKGYRVGGTGATVNARRNGSSNHLASAVSLSSADTWTDGGSVQNTAYAAGDKLEIMVVSVTGSPTQVAVQVDFTRP